jgi:hypothetical protein
MPSRRVPRLAATIGPLLFVLAAPLAASQIRSAPRRDVHRPSIAFVQDAPHIVAAVAVDLDADGDLDVVATDDAAHLIVWMNDGGRFVRTSTVSDTAWPVAPRPRSLDDRPAVSEVSTPGDSPTAGTGGTPVLTTFERRGLAMPAGSPSLAHASQIRLPGRAPPAIG